MLAQDDLELGFERYLELLMRDERLAQEFEASRIEFFEEPLASRLPGAERRHLEWFLLERPSAALGTVPAQAWQAAGGDGGNGTPTELGASLLQSLAGAFEVTSLVRGEGLWVRDLFTLGEHPVVEARASLGLEVGDLLVGRLFPAGAGVFLLSPAASVFRNPALLAAVRVDLAHMRAARRGVLRVQQLELERLFHGPGSVATVAPAPEDAFAEARAALVRLGLPPEEVERGLASVRAALRAGDGSVLTEVMNRIAFETGVDLAAARLVLVELWEGLAPRSEVSQTPSIVATDTEAALAAFDRGRAEGRDLEQLFRELERDLGVESDVESDVEADAELADDDSTGAPDFPGVVGAMIEEFLWELGHEQGEASARAFEPLRVLGTYAQDIGVFDELSPARLVDFSARWLLDEAGTSGTVPAEDVVSVLDALGEFCRWCEERHGLPLWKGFEPTFATLRASVPRHLRLRLSTTSTGAGAFRVLRVEAARAYVREASGEELELDLSATQAADLREGDLVRVARRAGVPVLGASYPAELAELLALE